MQESFNYSLDHSTAKVNLTVTDNRFIAETQGKGALDKPRHINIPFSNLKNFCLVATIGVQNLSSFRTAGDYSYDSEFIFSYKKYGKIKSKRILVNSHDESFLRLLTELERRRPDASLLHLPPEEALKQMRVTSAAKSVKIFIGLLVAVAMIVTLIFIIFKIIHRG
jgi:hypothetical protein